ncbi:MAG TPA: SBBP repeat-containing protein, partial [Anaerolineae bacterium]|nr:SBBP repeat-containing protein [Anaerolineae bacterium]
MRRWAVLTSVVVLLFVAFLAVPLPSLGPAVEAPLDLSAPASAAADNSLDRDRFLQLPLTFVLNRGQVPGEVSYYIQGSDKNVYFNPSGVTYLLEGEAADGSGRGPYALRLEYLAANPQVTVEGADPASTRISYFRGPKESWQTNLPTFSSLVYSELWPGIDLRYSGTVSHLKYEFVVAPGTDPALIRLVFHGATELRLNEQGQLEVVTPAGVLTDEVPYAYQQVEGQEVPVDVRYDFEPRRAGGLDGLAYGFQLGDYDPSLPLIIDPASLLYCGYIGGAGNDEATGIAVDSLGYAYVTGYTYSITGFPISGTGWLSSTILSGGADAFVAKVDRNGKYLDYCGYLGGVEDEWAYDIAVDSAGSAYIVGWTESAEDTFPVTVGPGLVYGGGQDAFVAKLDPSGTSLSYCGYIGGASFDVGEGIAVDASGHAYIAGGTNSEAATFPVGGTSWPGSTANNGGAVDAFVAKVNPSGSALIWCGFL